MMHPNTMPPVVAIVDYGMGNLFSVHAACMRAGLSPRVTADPDTVYRADLVLLPGVGAFGDAIAALRSRGLAHALCAVAAAGHPLIGICLGMQLFASESEEFGKHPGLGIIPGRVVHLGEPHGSDGATLKVPHIGWNAIARPGVSIGDPWSTTPLDGLPDGTACSFVHSYHVIPDDADHVLAVTRYGDTTLASAVRSGNVYGFQFHPERSGDVGAWMYTRFLRLAMPAYATNH